MSKEPKQAAAGDEEQGAPEWMVTYSDCMTLLLTFFVLLLTFSSFDDKIYRQFHETLFEDLPQIYLQVRRSKSSFLNPEEPLILAELEEGSEKLTLEGQSKANLLMEKEPKEFTERRVFYVDSDRIFWAEGTSMSADGQRTLRLMGLFLKRIEGRIVVSENGLDDGGRSEELGLARALAVVEYLAEQVGLDEGRFSISAVSTMDSSTRLSRKGKRALEIVILERSVYD
jgi:chemotaxis protein MotB